MVSFKGCRDIKSISNNPVIHTSWLNNSSQGANRFVSEVVTIHTCHVFERTSSFQPFLQAQPLRLISPAYKMIQWQQFLQACPKVTVWGRSSPSSISNVFPSSSSALHSSTTLQTASGSGRPNEPCKFAAVGTHAQPNAGLVPTKNNTAGCTAPFGKFLRLNSGERAPSLAQSVIWSLGRYVSLMYCTNTFLSSPMIDV